MKNWKWGYLVILGVVIAYYYPGLRAIVEGDSKVSVVSEGGTTIDVEFVRSWYKPDKNLPFRNKNEEFYTSTELRHIDYAQPWSPEHFAYVSYVNLNQENHNALEIKFLKDSELGKIYISNQTEDLPGTYYFSKYDVAVFTNFPNIEQQILSITK